MSLSQSTSTAPATSTSTASTTAPVVQQPYGNQAMLEDIGLSGDPDLEYMRLNGFASQVSYEECLAFCLADAKEPGKQKWLMNQTFGQIQANAPELVPQCRDVLWPVGRKVTVDGNVMAALEFGVGLERIVTVERKSEGFDVEMEGIGDIGLALGGETGKVLEEISEYIPMGFSFGGLEFDVGAETGLEFEWAVTAGWDLPTEAMDVSFTSEALSPNLDALERAISMVIEAFTVPDRVEAKQTVSAGGDGAVKPGTGVSGNVDVGVASTFGYDKDSKYTEATLSAEGAVGFDWGLLSLLDVERLKKAAAGMEGTIGLRAELPPGETDPNKGRAFATYSSESDAGGSSTWEEIGGLGAVYDYVLGRWAGADGGIVATNELPDRTLMRTVEVRLDDQPRVKELAEASGFDPAQTTVRISAALRVGTDAVAAALVGDTFNTEGENTEGALLDAERQIAAYYLGESYEWPGSGQVQGGLGAGAEQADAEEATMEVTARSEWEVGLANKEEHHALALATGSSTEMTRVIPLEPHELRSELRAAAPR